MSSKSEAARRADAAALRAAVEKLDGLLLPSGEDVDEMVDDFDRLRKEGRSNDESKAHSRASLGAAPRPSFPSRPRGRRRLTSLATWRLGSPPAGEPSKALGSSLTSG
jgi:hypothetical protein